MSINWFIVGIGLHRCRWERCQDPLTTSAKRLSQLSLKLLFGHAKLTRVLSVTLCWRVQSSRRLVCERGKREKEKEAGQSRGWCRLSSLSDRRRWSCSSNWLQAAFVHSGLLLLRLLRLWWRCCGGGGGVGGDGCGAASICWGTSSVSQRLSSFNCLALASFLSLPLSSPASPFPPFIPLITPSFPSLATPLPPTPLPSPTSTYFTGRAVSQALKTDGWWWMARPTEFLFLSSLPPFSFSPPTLSRGQDFAVFDAPVLRLMRMCFGEGSRSTFGWLEPIASSLASETSIA